MIGEKSLISVVTPAHNVERYIAEAIESVALQDWPRIEHVVIDDGSTDGTGATLRRIAREPGPVPLRVIGQANGGAASARNAGLAAARGAYVAFVDADDRLDPRCLSRLAAALEEPGLDLVFPLWTYLGADGAPLGIASRFGKPRYDLGDLLAGNPVHSATGVMLRRSAAEAVGVFDTTLTACIDLDYWVRVAALRPGNIGCVPEPLAFYRRREGQITGSWRRMEANWGRVFAKAQAAVPDRVAPVAAEARARTAVYWSALAYAEGDYRAARRLCAEAWRGAPRALMRDRQAVVRAFACCASLLPRRLHDVLRDGFNAARRRLGLDFS